MSVEAIIKPAPIAEIVPPPSLTGVFKVQERISSILTRKAEPALAINTGIGEVGRHRFSNGFSNEINRGTIPLRGRNHWTVPHSGIKSVDRLKRRGSGRSRRCRTHGERHSSGNQCQGDGISKSQPSKPQTFFINKLPSKSSGLY